MASDWPQVIDGETRWACCVSAIGSACQHITMPDGTTGDPYDRPIGVFEGTRWHMHAEPICADPECVTYLTRDEMRQLRGEA